MKKLVTIALLLLMAIIAKAQEVYTVGYYNEGERNIAALYRNSERLYTASLSNQTSKATRVTCDSQGNVYWFINYYEFPDNTYLYSEVRKNNQVYATNENHSEIHVSDMYCINDTLYYTGYQYNQDSIMVATVWKGDNFATHWILGDGVHSCLIYNVDIDKSTGIPFFCGYVIDGKKKASVWKEQNLLFTFDQDSIQSQAEISSSSATQIAVENGHVYTMGDYDVENAVPLSVIWEDNLIKRYVNSYFESFHGICAFDNSCYYAYTSRYQYYDAILKDNQEMLILSYAYKLFSTHMDIYVAGKDSDNKFYIWRNFEKECHIEHCDYVSDMTVVETSDIPDEFNAEWYYEILNVDGSITYQHLEAEGDTVVQGKRPKIIIRSNTQYDRDAITTTTHEYVYEEDGIVYWWNKDLEEFTVLYDLTAEIGDEWEIKVGNDSITMHVDGVDSVEYEGRTYRMLHVSDANDLFSGDIVCGIGHLTSFFPERLMNRNKGYRVEGLRCYWVDDELIFKHGDEDCDAVYAELHQGLEETTNNGFAVYPNPADGILFVETRRATSLPAEQTYRITNLMGQTMMTGVLAERLPQCDSPTTIDVSDLPAGMYFISVGGQTVKFVKQ